MDSKFEKKITIDNIEYTEDLTTGVIYKITNIINQKIYIGKASSYEKHGKNQDSSYYSAVGRLRRHISNALSNDILKRNECPNLYNAIREHGKENFIVEILKVVSKKKLKEWETKYTQEYKEKNPENCYNIFIGDNKPIDDKNRIIYEQTKASTNRHRCKNGSQKHKQETQALPPCIFETKRDNKLVGYRYQFIDNQRVRHNKSFASNSLTMEQKLNEAIKALLERKKKLGMNIDDLDEYIKNKNLQL